MSLLPDDNSGRITRATPARPFFLTLLAIILFLFGLLAFFGSLFLWGQGFVLAPPPGINYALPVADIVVNAPASILAAVGLWRLRRYGYLAAYFVAGIYLYASVFILIDAFVERPPDFWTIIVPQALAVVVSVALLLYLPRVRSVFR